MAHTLPPQASSQCRSSVLVCPLQSLDHGETRNRFWDDGYAPEKSFSLLWQECVGWEVGSEEGEEVDAVEPGTFH